MDSTIDTALASSTWLAVVRAYQTCAKRYEELLSFHRLTPAQFDTLDAISRLADKALPKNIAEALLVTRGNVTGLLQRLENAELISLTTHSDDGRARVARLTDKGQRLHAQAKRSTRGFVSEQLAPFSRADLDQVHATMNTMHFHLLGMNVEDIHVTAQTKATWQKEPREPKA